MDETELCGACLLELPSEHFTWPGCQEPHRLHVSCLSGMLASLPRWPRVPPVEPELQEAICESLRAAHPNDPRDTLPHLDCPLCRQRWTDVPAICAAACALPRWPGTEAGAAQPQPGPSDQQQRPTRPPVAMVVCGGLEQREMEWSTFQISNTWFGEWQCRSEICARTHSAVAEPVGVPTLWLRQRLPQVALPTCHCGSMPLTTVLFHNPAASPAAEDSWRATWTCLGCGIWDHFTRGPPTDAAALERVAELTDVETWSAWCDAPGRSAFWQQAFDFAKRTLTGLHMEGEQNCGSVGPPSNLGPTNSQLFVPLLLDAAGLLLNQAGAAWRAHELIGPGWERWTTVLRAAQPVRMSELADALQGELGLQGPGLRPDARRMNLISCVLWMSSVRTGPGNTATASLAEVVGNSCLHNGYLPSLVQEVLLAKYGGVDMSREVLQVADAVRAAQAPGPVLPSAAASTTGLFPPLQRPQHELLRRALCRLPTSSRVLAGARRHNHRLRLSLQKMLFQVGFVALPHQRVSTSGTTSTRPWRLRQPESHHQPHATGTRQAGRHQRHDSVVRDRQNLSPMKRNCSKRRRSRLGCRWMGTRVCRRVWLPWTSRSVPNTSVRCRDALLLLGVGDQVGIPTAPACALMSTLICWANSMASHQNPG